MVFNMISHSWGYYKETSCYNDSFLNIIFAIQSIIFFYQVTMQPTITRKVIVVQQALSSLSRGKIKYKFLIKKKYSLALKVHISKSYKYGRLIPYPR